MLPLLLRQWRRLLLFSFKYNNCLLILSCFAINIYVYSIRQTALSIGETEKLSIYCDIRVWATARARTKKKTYETSRWDNTAFSQNCERFWLVCVGDCVFVVWVWVCSWMTFIGVNKCFVLLRWLKFDLMRARERNVWLNMNEFSKSNYNIHTITLTFLVFTVLYLLLLRFHSHLYPFIRAILNFPCHFYTFFLSFGKWY